MKLAGQVALVSGASRGIGRAVALAFAREGARLALGARGRPALERLEGELGADGDSVLVVPGDAADEATLGRFGRLDCLVTAQGRARSARLRPRA